MNASNKLPVTPAHNDQEAGAKETLTSVQDAVAEVFGDIAEFWGFTRTQGRIFGLTFMSPEPLGQSTIRARLKISAGGASQTLASLVEWGVLHREGRAYVAETNFFALITRVLRTREKGQVEHAIVRVKTAIDALRQTNASLSDRESDIARQVAFAIERGDHLLGFFELGRDFLLALVERNPVRALLNGLARRAQRLRPLKGQPKTPTDPGETHAPV